MLVIVSVQISKQIVWQVFLAAINHDHMTILAGNLYNVV